MPSSRTRQTFVEIRTCDDFTHFSTYKCQLQTFITRRVSKLDAYFFGKSCYVHLALLSQNGVGKWPLTKKLWKKSIRRGVIMPLGFKYGVLPLGLARVKCAVGNPSIPFLYYWNSALILGKHWFPTPLELKQLTFEKRSRKSYFMSWKIILNSKSITFKTVQ